MQLLKKCLILLCVLALLLSAVSCTKEEPITPPESDLPSRSEHADKVVYATEHCSITVAMLNYMLYSEYLSFCDYYGIYLSFVKGDGGTALDQSKPLREQNYSVVTDSVTGETVTTTWFDVFAEYTKTSAQQMLVLCEAAYASSLTLDEADLQRVDTYIEQVTTYATSNGKTVEEYLSENFGEGVTTAEVRAVSEYSLLATKQSEWIAEEIAAGVTDEAIDSFYEQNRALYDTGVDFLTVTFTVSYAPENAEAVADALTAYEAAQLACRERMDALAAATDRAAFEALLLDYFKEDAIASGEEDPDAAAALALQGAFFQNYEGSENGGSMDIWLLDASRSAGNIQTFVTETSARDAESGNLKQVSSSYTACFLVQGLHRNESVTRDVGHILFMTSTFAGLSTTTSLIGETKELAESLLTAGETLSAENMSKALLKKMMEEGAITTHTDENGETYYTVDRAKFEDYGDRFTQDSNVFYDDVPIGMMVAEFENWLFDSARHPDEISYAGAVQTSYGYHIMYYGGEGEETWRIDARADVEESLYDAWTEAAEAEYLITETAENWSFVAA